ncbi:UvrD-helicase domain-containing protein [Serinibacter arcticus]|uniref:UvrD-helicase domain-containing protein n=1 Tax=Serinibacter arcticus TaxID=1655435 RepID=UPI001092BA22|nr:UvrD-helicase domain-containing protein [Serinibacter arcticus]
MTLPDPVGRQHEVVFLNSAQHNVVLGTAGTGKTTMAIHRAVHLAHPATVNCGPVLLVTFNKALVRYLEHLRPAGEAQITIETYSSFARGYLNARGQMPRRDGIAQKGQLRALIELAIQEIRALHPGRGVLTRQAGWFEDELGWISGMGFTTIQEYQAARRIGRQTPLNAGTARDRVWLVREAYLRARSLTVARYDWDDLASAVRAQLAADPNPRRYRHIVVDEGQDFSPEIIRSLAEAVQPGGSLTFFGDYHQAIYGQGMSWRSAGINLGGRPVERFVDNYRNTKAIADLAIALSRTPAMAGEAEDLVVPRAPVAAGPRPALVLAGNRAREIELVQSQALGNAGVQSVAILARTWSLAEGAAWGLQYRRLDGDNLRAWDPTPGVWVGPYHAAKGLEFDFVIMPSLGFEHLPHPDVASAFDPAEAAAREARLLYVAVTRARAQLLLTYTGTLTPLLPFAGSGLWLESEYP